MGARTIGLYHSLSKVMNRKAGMKKVAPKIVIRKKPNRLSVESPEREDNHSSVCYTQQPRKSLEDL